MKLVEPEFEHEADTDGIGLHPTPPRPERRRVHLSLIVTLAVLVTTVVLVYAFVPKRVGALQDAALDLHADFGDFELVRPSQAELEAWSVGLVGPGVPWPQLSGQILGARRVEVLNRVAAAVRLSLGDNVVTFIAGRAVDAPPRTRRKQRDGVHCVSYRRGHWTLVAAGPTSDAARWLHQLGAPGGKPSSQ